MDQSCGTNSPLYFRPTRDGGTPTGSETRCGAAGGHMRRTSDTLAADTFSSRAVSRTPRPSSNAARIRSILNGVVLGLPRRLPDDRARSRPAITRSRIIDLSNSPNKPNIPNSARPDGVEVSRRLLVQVEVDLAGSQFTQQTDQIGQRSSQATDRPCGRDVEVSPGNPLQQSIQPRPLGATRGTADPLVAEDGHHRPAKPSSGLLQGRKLVLDRLAAITGADPDIQGGASGRCCHAGSISRIGHPSIAMIVGQGLHK